MTDWTAGYVADIGYTFGYYTELNPLRVQLQFLNSGLALPGTGAACELGFGQGLSANVHAAASMSKWYGTDFNPAQAAFAQQVNDITGAGAELFDQGFDEFCNRQDLPDFDYIGLHGIWSWISDENRKTIVDFIRRKLKVGGVVYISYNTLPGWAPMVPMRHLLTEHAEVMAAPGRGIVSRIDAAIEFTEKLLAVNPAYARANAVVGPKIDAIKAQNRHYLAHEYFNRDWLPMHFADMAGWLSPAKLSYACPAFPLDHVDAMNLNADQQAFLKEIPDSMFRESVRDFVINQQFRRDYWVKGARKLSVLEQHEGLRQQRVILVSPRSDVTLKVSGALGEASLSEAIYVPILDVLADHKPRSIGQLEQIFKDKATLTLGQVTQAVLVLLGKGDIAIAQSDKVTSKVRGQTDKLNTFLMQKARGNSDVSYLASPVTGGGITLPRFEQLFLLAHNQGKKPEEWGNFVFQLLMAQGQRIVKDGKPMDAPEDNLAELNKQAAVFAEKRITAMRALGIAA